MRLDEFILEEQKDLIAFQKYWREMHSKNPQQYPSITDHNIWKECFKNFQELKGN